MYEKKRTVIICSRNVSKEVNDKIKAHVSALEAKGWHVHWPTRDTKKNDTNGLEVCRQNRAAIYMAQEVHVWYESESQGSHFDIGMSFAFDLIRKRRWIIINKSDVKATPDKSFQNVLLALDKASS